MARHPDLSGQHVFITGAARGLGRSMAEKLAGCGATVAVADLRCCRTARRWPKTSAPQAARRMRYCGRRGRARTVHGRAPRSSPHSAGRIDAVVNNAMLLRYEPVEQITEETLTRMTAIGINGSIWGAQALLAHYDAARGGAHHQHGLAGGGEGLSQHGGLQRW